MGYKEEKQRQLDSRYMRMARIWAENSYCIRRQVGALIVKDKMIISDGYNGTPSGFENICEDEAGLTKPYVLHAEANAITKVAKSANNCEGATLYITASPCIECSKLIIQAGIKRVVYSDDYHKSEGLDLLRRVGIEIAQIKSRETNRITYLIYEKEKLYRNAAGGADRDYIRRPTENTRLSGRRRTDRVAR